MVAERAARSGWPSWWLRRGAAAVALAPLAQLFGAATALRRGLYRMGLLPAQRLPVPVVVVGNLTVGGAGKTPLIAALVPVLRAAGWQPGIVSRGYGGAARAVQPVTARSDPAAVGDEPLLLARATGAPVAVGRRRAEAARALLAAHPDVNVLLADDGLQHLALSRDLELVVVDTRLWGNGWLLPAGPLREPPARRRDATLGPAEALQRLPPGPEPRFVLARRPGAVRPLVGEATPRSLAEFAREQAGQPVGALAGIGHPQQFFDMLQAAGLNVIARALPDHARITAADWAAMPAAGPVLITAKDAVKSTALPPAWRERLWVVGLEVELPADFIDWICRRLEALRGRPIA